jgi:acyl transferase domain-containing protein
MASPRSIVRRDGPLQSISFARAVESSGIHASDISFVGAHGPGTQQGDPAELLTELFSICSVLARQGSRYPENFLAIGSIKGNVGHSGAASGTINLFKVLAMMRYQRIAPQANFHPSNLSPGLHSLFEDYPIRMIKEYVETDCSR